MRLPPPSSQSPTARASTRARGRVGNALKSKVASVLPTGNCALFRWRRMRRMSRSASSYSASTARKRAGPTFGIGPAFSENQAAISAQSLWKLGSRSAVSMLGSVWMQVSRAVTRMPPAAHRSWPGRGGVTATSVSSAVTFGASRDARASGFGLLASGFGLLASGFGLRAPGCGLLASGCVEVCVEVCRQQMCQLRFAGLFTRDFAAMKSRSTIRRQASRLGRSRCNTFHASAYSVRGNRLSR
jgi:hypothetical protein